MAALVASNRWLEVVQHVRTTIAAGKIRPGEPLPSVRYLAETLKCAPGTVQRAYEELEKERLIDKRPFRPYVVAETQQLVRDATDTALLERIDTFVNALRSEGFGDRIAPALRLYVKERLTT